MCRVLQVLSHQSRAHCIQTNGLKGFLGNSAPRYTGEFTSKLSENSKSNLGAYTKHVIATLDNERSNKLLEKGNTLQVFIWRIDSMISL